MKKLLKRFHCFSFPFSVFFFFWCGIHFCLLLNIFIRKMMFNLVSKVEVENMNLSERVSNIRKVI